MNFTDRYGPWAIIAGASEGIGRELAKQIAAQGLDCILIARREAPLRALADEIENEFDVECLCLAIDLSANEACDKIVAAVGEREIGLYVSNAGADPNGSHFLDSDIGTWTQIIQRNVLSKIKCCHHFGQKMQARKRGGILLIGSGGCYGGASYMASYSASKAFELCFAESLWAELRSDEVDVLYMALSMTDTPALRKLLDSKGLPLPDNIANPADVAKTALTHLRKGPICNWGLEDDEAGYGFQSAKDRRERILQIDIASARVFGQ
ncbi:SDR family NAD(P)-dependent oxidoreductase [Zhongshania aquimaris]|uniref:SDR family NAD(P)-dependent oxidoreductase n=1 Tax=Zhongshania aquimaris TaxID=2857107 RepID=A0ABS6VWK5_9GAMM|nr:SDR family NAD(P)-dependent oxidoreductase [Zhongshania aquimaris]MBW2942714.1 SDR family NAD(P)-dependent oxidoreductase [Zhongshania aquimaris]